MLKTEDELNVFSKARPLASDRLAVTFANSKGCKLLPTLHQLFKSEMDRFYHGASPAMVVRLFGRKGENGITRPGGKLVSMRRAAVDFQ